MITIDTIRKYCLNKKGVTEGFPFDDATLVFKVVDKIFCIANLNGVLSVNLKCKPELAIELREKFDAVQPGYHMNKKHWNTIIVNEITTTNLLWEWIDLSYELVVGGLTKKNRLELENL